MVVFSVSNSHFAYSQDKKDSLAIKNASLDYIEGYFEKDAKRMERALHPELVKRTLAIINDSTDFIVNLGATFMVFRAGTNDNKHALNPEKGLVATVEIFNITGNAASAMVSTNQYKFIDYLHLCKTKGEWKIINVFWIDAPKK